MRVRSSSGLRSTRLTSPVHASPRRITPLTKRIAVIGRLRHTFNAPIPALLVTGDISVERKQEAEACGYELLQKPVPPMTLRAS